jgi:hypothetical protein
MADRVEFIISARDKYSKTMGSLTKMLPSLKTAAIATGAAIAGLGVALFALTKKTAESFDAVQKFSDQLGLSTEFLSSMQHAADLSGVAVGNMNKALQMLQVRVGEANRGIGQGKDAFDALGVSLRDASGQLHTAETILPRLADAFRNMSSATERAEAASKIFGQRGIAMLQILKDGSAGLAEMTAEAERFGLVVSAEAGARAAEFNDSLTRLKASFIGLRNTLATEIMPIITGLANRWADYIAQNREDITKWAFDFIKVVGNVAEYTGYAVAGMIDIWRGLEMTFHLLLAAAADFGAHFLEIFDTISGGTDRFIKFISDFAPALGVTGVAIEMLTRQWRENSSTTQEAVENLREFSSEQVKMLIDIVDTGSAIGRMNEYLQIFKDTIAEISAESFEREAGGIPPFTDANFAKAQEVRKNFEDMYTGSQNMLYDLGLMEFETFAEDLEKLQSTKLQSISALSQQTATLVGARCKKVSALRMRP